ncbi:N-acetylneuraminate synthase family protein [Puniceicoccaceae bacterium K14]|nr:N-acetylneuraminate synthase family protein [Puniceicoccaceae bacterium K14]
MNSELNFKLPSEISIPQVIAEIGCNHKGDINIAKQLIVVAKTCGATVAKFQKRNSRELLTEEQYNAPYDNRNSYGTTYGEHREFLEFSAETHKELKTYCEEHEIVYATSVWDLISAKEIAALEPSLIKIPSACNNHLEMLSYLRDNYAGEVHISTGMSTPEEIDAAIDVYKTCPERVILYACTSGYPVDFKDVCMLEILKLRTKYQDTGRVKSIGFSGHHNGIAIDTFSALLGVSYIERHFTLDRSWKGSDHAASLEPGGLRRLTRDIEHIAESWTYKQEDILPVEIEQRKKLKFRKVPVA